MTEQFGDKTHDATPFRRQKAREEGHVPRSHDLASAIMLLAAVLALMWAGRQVVEFLGAYALAQLGDAPPLTADVQLAANTWTSALLGLAQVLLPIFAALVVVAIAANLGQIGFVFLPNKVAPDVSHIDPLKGFQRLFSMNSAMRLAFGIFKIIVVASAALVSLYGRREEILASTALELPQLAALLADITFWTLIYAGVALLVLAILDYTWQRWKYEQDIRMTTQELREELKTLQGDPHILSRRRQVQRQLAMSRMGQAIPRADVVITNPTELAVAIQYDMATMPAPIVVAKGAGLVAQRIRRTALENDIPIVERKQLAQFLYKHVEINQPILHSVLLCSPCHPLTLSPCHPSSALPSGVWIGPVGVRSLE
jgi:flagellar biosynthetic protein FlhB